MIETTELRLAMLANGYQPLPAQGKRVLLEGWSTKATVASSEVSAWGTEHPQWNNTGTLTSRTPTIDGDIRDPAAAEAFEELARDWLDERGRILVRIGEAPKRAILCRTAQPFAKIKVDLVAPSGSTHKIEILGDGQQLVVAGIHPDTRKPYSWHGGEPWTVQWSELPEITEAEAREFIARAAAMLEREFGFRRTGEPGNGHTTAEEFIIARTAVDIEQELAGIHFGNIHDTWLHCMGSMLRAGTPANEVMRRLKQAAEQSPRCQDDPRKKLWPKALAEMMTWYVRSDPTFIANLETKQQQDWHARVQEGRNPRLTWRDDYGLQVRREYTESGADNQLDANNNNRSSATASAHGPKFKLLSYRDLRPGINDQDYRVDELLPMEGLVIVWGKFKCLKTFWVYDLALHIAKGWEYRDRAVRQGMVIYCAFEGAHGFRKRTEAQRRHYKLADDDDVPLHVMPCQMNLIRDHNAFIKDIGAQLRDGEKPTVVVLDTLNRSLVGSESKDADMANYIAAASAIREAFNCLVIIVHHCGWDETRPRGHSSLPGAVEGQLAVVRDGDRITVLVEFLRDGPEGAEIHSLTKLIDVGQDATGKRLTSLVVVPSNLAARKDGGWAKALLTFRRALRAALTKYGESFQETVFETPVRAVAVEDVRQEFYEIYIPASGDDPEQRQDAKLKKFNRDLEQAQREGLVRCREPAGQAPLIWPSSGVGEEA
jgi:hypothetical protein